MLLAAGEASQALCTVHPHVLGHSGIAGRGEMTGPWEGLLPSVVFSFSFSFFQRSAAVSSIHVTPVWL